MDFHKLNKEEYVGKSFKLSYRTKTYIDIRSTESGFDLVQLPFEKEMELSFEDCFFNEWLEDPVAYGAFEGETLIGYVEGSIEKWNNRYRISNICLFDEDKRNCGIGGVLMGLIMDEAKASGARMAVLETQTSNEKAISFYRKHGFEIIGFDLYAYTNDDPARHEVRIEMGKVL